MKLVLEASETDFKSKVLDSTQPVLVNFWAEACGSCRLIAPWLEEIASENKSRIKVVKTNLDKNPNLARQYYVQSTPTLIFFYHGLVYDQITGTADRETILAKLENILTVVR